MISGSAGTSNQYTYNASGTHDSGAGSGALGARIKGASRLSQEVTAQVQVITAPH